jgi:hypothetical protein
MRGRSGADDGSAALLEGDPVEDTEGLRRRDKTAVPPYTSCTQSALPSCLHGHVTVSAAQTNMIMIIIIVIVIITRHAQTNKTSSGSKEEALFLDSS